MKTFFLSHSSKDWELADSVYEVFKSFIDGSIKLKEEYNIFYSKINLKTDKGQNKAYRQVIYDALHKSSAIVVLWTPNSVFNKWVNFEVGVATGINGYIEKFKKRNEVGNSIDNAQITIVPTKTDTAGLPNIITNNQEIFSLNEYEDVIHMMKKVFGKMEVDIEAWAHRNGNLIHQVNQLASKRCVYFVGGNKDCSIPPSDGWDDNKVCNFVTKLVRNLIKEKFTVASFPDVPCVGMQVAKTANEMQGEYEISGLYLIDDALSKKVEEWNGDLSDWENKVKEFRKIYLENKHFIIVIGGGKYTKAECDVAKEKGIPIFPIPCFGGYGRQLFYELKKSSKFKHFEHPCNRCENNDGLCSKHAKFVTRFKKYIKP